MPDAQARTAYGGWLGEVFAQILFPPESEAFFREILGKILDKTQEIEFTDMPVMQSIMIELLHSLQQINATGSNMKSLKKPLLYNLLTPIREAKVSGSSARYIGNEFDFMDSIDKPVVFKILVEQLLKSERKPDLDLYEVNEFSKEVNTQIGRILLELNSNPIFKSLNTGWKGGSTRKRKRVGRLNAKTRSGGTRSRNRNTRRKSKANNLKCKRSRRA